MIHKGIEFAIRAHGQQKRKGSDLLYIVHPFETALILSQAGASETLICAGLLHDTLEDTDVTYEQLRKEFGAEVADLVLSRSEDKEKTWEERKSVTVNKIQSLNYEQKLLLCADKLSNMRDIDRDYPKEGDALWTRFRMQSKSALAWYYKGIRDVLAERFAGMPAYEEYCRLVNKNFGPGPAHTDWMKENRAT